MLSLLYGPTLTSVHAYWKNHTSKEIAQVGAISANSDQNIGDLIAKAMDKVGLQ